jgi:hypothetical protein
MYLLRFMAILLLLSVTSVYANSSASFNWLNVSDNPQLFQMIEKVFSDELRPDIPEKVKPYVPISYKYIARIGVFRNSYIILIGYREHKSDPEEYDCFEAFSYDRITKIKDRIEPKDVFFKWSFIGFATFESAIMPDVIFKYYDCLECERVELVSSFMFDQQNNKWNVRIWPNDDPSLMIASDTQIGDDFWSYDCLHAITDVNSDGFDDIVIRCRETAESTKATSEEILLYTIQKGVAQKIKVQDKKMIDQLNGILCKGQDSPLCR